MRFVATCFPIAVLFAVLLAVLPAPAWAAKPAAEYDFLVEGRIEIGPDGRVRDYSVDKATPGLVRGLVDKAVRAWQFEPIVEGGRAVVGITNMKLKLTAVPHGDDYLLRVEHVWFGALPPHKMKPPKWPSHVPVTGQVVLVLLVDETGRVSRLHVERTDLGALGSPPEMARWRSRFEAAALAAAKRWEFGPIEVIDGKPVATNVRVPVAFSDKPGPFYRGESRPAPWIVTNPGSTTATAAGDDATPDEADFDSRFRLRSDVIGKAL